MLLAPQEEARCVAFFFLPFFCLVAAVEMVIVQRLLKSQEVPVSLFLSPSRFEAVEFSLGGWEVAADVLCVG